MSDKLLRNPKALMNITRRIILEAGDITLKYFDECGFGSVETKDDGSPVTKADQDTEAFIAAELAKILPGVPMIGEESVSSGQSPDTCGAEHFWLVDPIDGTKQFIAGKDEFTVNIALIHQGNPVMGAVYAPAKGELYLGYTGPDGQGEAFRWLEDTDKEKQIQVRKPPQGGLNVIIGGAPKPGGKTEQFLSDFKIAKITRKASSLKGCVVALGKADLYPCFGRTCLWDTAAAHAVLLGAGGIFMGAEGAPLTYDGTSKDFYNPPFIAAGFNPFE